MKPNIKFFDETFTEIPGTVIWNDTAANGDHDFEFIASKNSDVSCIAIGGNEFVFEAPTSVAVDAPYRFRIPGQVTRKDWADKAAEQLGEEFSATDARGNPISIYNATRVAEVLRAANNIIGSRENLLEDMERALHYRNLPVSVINKYGKKSGGGWMDA